MSPRPTSSSTSACTSNLELDIDGEFAVGGPDTGEFTFDRTAPDNLWTSLKLGLLDFGDEAGAWTAGIQLGPKLPLAHGNMGVGVEGLVLVGWRIRQTQLVLNLGGLLDPMPDPNTPRPAAFEGGLDIARPLDADRRWTLTGGISGVRYVSPDNDQLNFTIGVTWSPTDTLDVSVMALGGVAVGRRSLGVADRHLAEGAALVVGSPRVAPQNAEPPSGATRMRRRPPPPARSAGRA